MAGQEFGAFISYRRGETDEIVARALHRLLEGYRTPRRLVRAGFASRIGRVFLDTAEREAAANLDQAIRASLDASAWLIVVCSKRTPASSWVTQEIAHFAAARRDRVLVLLVDGEPEESYPAPLLEGGEPKAADIRASSRTRTLAKLKRSEKLALLAPILGVRFDDLKLRERQRQRRRAVAAFSVAGTLLMGFALMLAMIRTESLRSQLLETLDGIQEAIPQNDHQRAAGLALEALSLNREHGLDRANEIERVVRDGFDVRFFRRRIAKLPAEIRSVAVSDDGSRIAVAARGDLVLLERGAEGREYASREADTQNEEITTLAYQPGTRLLAAGSANGIVFLFDVDGMVKKLEIGFSRINHVAFGPEGGWLAIASEGGLFLHSTAMANLPPRTLETAAVVHSAAFSGAGEWLASTTGNRITIRQIRTDSATAVYRELALSPGFDALHVDIDSDSFRLAATASAFQGQNAPQSAVFVWEDFRNDSTPRRVFVSDDISVRATFSNTGEILVFGADTPMRFVDPSGRVSEPVEGAFRTSVALKQPTNEIITVDSESGDLVGLDFFARSLLPFELSFDAAAPVRDLVFVGERGDMLAVAYHGDAAPTLWALGTFVPGRVSLGGVAPGWLSAGTTLSRLTAVPLQPRRLIGALNRMLDDDENLVIWNPGQPAERGSLAGHRGNVNDVALDRSGELLASVNSIESIVKLHDFRTGETRDLTVPTDAPLIAVSLTVDNSGTRVAVGDQQGRVFVLDVDAKGTVELTRGVGPAPAEASVRFSPNGAWLATTGGPDGVRVFQREKDFREVELTPRATALDVAFSPDGTTLFAAIDDGRVLRWSLEQPEREAFALEPPGSAATAVAVSPDDKAVAIGFADGTVKVWPGFSGMVEYLETAMGHR